MDQETASNAKEEKRRSIKGLLTWLVLIPLILGTLICCGQFAMFFIAGDQGGYTSSLLAADYRPWPYEKIPPINVEAFMKDVQAEEETIIVGTFWDVPSPTAGAIAQVTKASKATNTPVAATVTPPTPTQFITKTPTVPTSTQRATSTILPTITNTVFVPSITATFPPPVPTQSNTQPPPPPQPTGTFTPTPTNTVTTVVPTSTPITPTSTFTFTPTPETPTVVVTTVSPTVVIPTYAPVRPIAENDGVADQMANGGCRAYFGYRNDNPSEVDILVGTQNNLNDQAAIDNPPQPTHFMVGRVFGAFEFTWYSGFALVWTLDDRAATANWCYPTPIP